MAGHFIVGGKKYEFPDKVKLGEARLIKQIAGVGTAEIVGALERGDPDVFAAMILIAMRRAGRQVGLDFLDALDMDAITFQAPEEEDEAAVPPAEAAETAATNGTPETTPSPSGTPPTEPIST